MSSSQLLSPPHYTEVRRRVRSSCGCQSDTPRRVPGPRLRRDRWRSLIRALTNLFVKATITPMLDVEVIDDPAAATVALEPVRSRLLAELAQPASAAMVATRLGLPRQKVNYHLRTLEAHGLVRVAEERRWGGLTERRLVA